MEIYDYNSGIFSLFYYFIEIVCLFTPDPKAYKVDEGEETKDKNPPL